MLLRPFVLSLLAGLLLLTGCTPDASLIDPATAPRVLVFSKTLGWRHDSIEPGQAMLRALGETHGFDVTFTEDAATFHDDSLRDVRAVVFLNTTGDVLDDTQQLHFQRYIQAGGGYVGIHSASDTEYGWSWYGRLVGGYFDGHPSDPNVREGVLTVVDTTHAATEHLPTPWVRTDEWYDIRDHNPDTRVLLTIDEASYKDDPDAGTHPMAWYHAFDGGRAFYTALGHTSDSYRDSLFIDHIWGGLRYAMGDREPDYARATLRPLPEQFTREVLEDYLNEPMELAVLDADRLLFVERPGAVRLHDRRTQQTQTLATLDVFAGFEEGLIGLTLDPSFDDTGWLYLAYSRPDTALIRVARFTLAGDRLDLATERPILEIPVQRDECCHVAGSLAFGPDGHLYIAVGDNTNPFASAGYAPIDERPGRAPWDAQRTSANPHDLRGKILRIQPQPDGSYTIPGGNLFADPADGRPEIYVMGNRNPFRIAIDQRTGYLYWGEIGPDAGEPRAQRGPAGHDEINQARQAGFFGWPYFVGDNKPYHDIDFATDRSGGAFDPARPVNDSPNAPEAGVLPPAQPAFIWYPYGASEAFPEAGDGGRSAMAGPVYHADAYGRAPAFPAAYDGKLLIYEWMRGWLHAVTFDADGGYAYQEPVVPGAAWSRPMDVAFGPDGALYLLEYGNVWSAQNPDARLVRVSYADGPPGPPAEIALSPIAGAAPLTVTYAARTDADAVEWTFGDGNASDARTGTHTFAAPGRYRVTLRATNRRGRTTLRQATVLVGNTPPDVTLALDGSTSFYTDAPRAYAVQVRDAEDGSLQDGGIDPRLVEVRIDYLPEGHDEAVAATGHQQAAAVPKGLKLIEEAACIACHQLAVPSAGPSFLAIAERYQDQRVRDELVEKVIQGGGGVWGEQAMAAHPHLPRDDVEAMVGYILGLLDDADRRAPPEGLLSFDRHDPPGTTGAYRLAATYTDQGGDGIGPLTSQARLLLRAPRIQAETLADADLATRLVTQDQTRAVRFEAGDQLVLREVDLTDVERVTVRVLDAPGTTGGRLSLRLGAPDGPVLGRAVLPAGGGTVSMPFAATRGRHTLYLVAEPSADAAAFAIDWLHVHLRPPGTPAS